MFFDSSRRAIDMPAPPTPDEVAAKFPYPVITLVAQDGAEETYAGTMSRTQDGRVAMEAVALTYTVWRNPEDRDDPVNRLDLTAEMRTALEMRPTDPLPVWMEVVRERMLYPSLWEAVRTTYDSDPRTRPTAESALVEHSNYVLMNVFRDQRVGPGAPWDVIDAATSSGLELTADIMVDGVPTAVVRLMNDPHVIGAAVDLGDRVLTAVIAREHAAHVVFEFATRVPGPQR